jgi:SWI/SNF-related matrix-associated actin-dependent regulator of chromatin subfamily A-like protein 1
LRGEVDGAPDPRRRDASHGHVAAASAGFGLERLRVRGRRAPPASSDDIRGDAYRPVSMPATFTASLVDCEAVLRFPFDERLRQLLRAIPGRRWDPEERVWRVPLDPERAEALTRFFAIVPYPVGVSDALLRALERRRAKRRPEECVLDLARPDQSWWFGFATDHGEDLVAALLEHPDAYSLPPIGRALVPLDPAAAGIVRALVTQTPRLRLTDDARRALVEIVEHATTRPKETLDYDVELRRDRGGSTWILVAAAHAPLVRSLARTAGLAVRDGPDASVALACDDRDGMPIAELLAHLDAPMLDPRVDAWLERAATWHGTIGVDGPPRAPVFVLIGDPGRLPAALRKAGRAEAAGTSLPLTIESWRLIDAQPLSGWISHAAKRCVAALAAGEPAPPAVLERSVVHEEPSFVLAPGHDAGLLEAFAAIPGAMPAKEKGEHEHGRLPAVRADPFCVPDLDAFIAETSTRVAPEALPLLQDIREQHAHAAGLVALSAATDATLELTGLGGELKPFQRAGVSYLLAQRRSFLADEQGLGKTIEALATLEADAAYPAIVVCPASLKLNWMREIERWLPARSTRMLGGTTARGPSPAADVTVVNYDIVAARLEHLMALTPRAVVLDESHYCKSAAAKRTQAVQRLCAAVPRDGLILALTGTPVMNRPAELIPQLRILGRLEDFGSGAQFGQRFRGPDAYHRLHWHMRARCFARRLKADVLPQLPAKTRAVIPVGLDNEPEYRLAEEDVIAWLRSQPLDLRELDAKVAAALRAERLVRLNALKLLAARGKLHAALAWMHDFLCSGERLIVFARHREIQAAVLTRFPAALHILGSDSHRARDESQRAFQAPDSRDNQLLVCSIEVAGQGITLTRSSNVAFLELDWTPAKHDQAEDRCHRIGQQDAVNATYLLAADTIDETIAMLLERKRAVIGAVTDGREQDDTAVLDALVAKLRGEPYRHLRAVA